MVNTFKLSAFGCAVIIALLASCVSGPPTQLIERNDHEGLEAWYQQEATNLRARAENMRQMAKVYEEVPFLPTWYSQRTGQDMVRHCQSLVKKYTKLAKEMEALARTHKEYQSIP